MVFRIPLLVNMSLHRNWQLVRVLRVSVELIPITLPIPFSHFDWSIYLYKWRNQINFCLIIFNSKYNQRMSERANEQMIRNIDINKSSLLFPYRLWMTDWTKVERNKKECSRIQVSAQIIQPTLGTQEYSFLQFSIKILQRLWSSIFLKVLKENLIILYELSNIR